MIDDLTMTKTEEAADDQTRICLPQSLDGLFHVPFFFSVPTGDLCIGLYQKVRSIKIKSCFPSGPDGFQADMIRDTAEHSLHSLLRLPHKAQRPCRHVLFVCRSILLLRHDLQNQSIQHSEIQILRPAEDHPIDLNGWGSLQKNSRSAAQRLCKKQIQLSVKLFFNISGQLVRLIPGSRVGRFTGSIKAIDKIIVIACGTAAYAGMVAKYAIEHWVRIPVEVELAHEFRYRDPILTPRTLVVAISQSGETMDTLMALRHAREQGSKVLAICNTQGASIPRESDAVLYTHAGPEVAVASTKAFVAQITAAYVLGLYLAQVKGAMFRDEIAQTLDSLKDMPRKIQWILDTQTKTVHDAAAQMVDAKSFLFLGRHVGYPVAMEGALKLKEIAYTFTEGFAAGELKHGPIALVDEGEPVVFIVPPARGRNVLHAKVISGIEEVKARGAYIIAVAEENDPDVERYADVVFWRPACPTLMSPLVDVVPLQLFAMDMAKLKNYDVDKPRNLAKSVTVE